MIKNRITELINVRIPIIQAGMVWVSGWKLASAVSNAGCFGIIGAGSMKPDLLREHILKCKSATPYPFGVNIPLLRGDANELLQVSLEENVSAVFTSAGNPALFIDAIKSAGAKAVHVVASVKQAKKAQSVGCDAVVGEGFEAGGHNGADEITTFSLIPQLVDALSIPVIAAGGIADGRQIAAAFALGAEGVQIGTRFAVTAESSAHQHYKDAVIAAGDAGTITAFKKIGLMRMIKNEFAVRAQLSDSSGDSPDEQRIILGAKRERLGIFEGDAAEGALEAGQSCGLIKENLSAADLTARLIEEFNRTLLSLSKELL